MDKSRSKINEIIVNYFNFNGNLNNWNLNVIFSSPSLYILLKILQLGAMDETYNELFNFTLSDDNENEIYEMLQNKNNAIVDINNRIFIKSTPKETFNKMVNLLYNAGVQHVDFSNIMLSIKTIDDWIFERTNGLIFDVMKNGNYITNDTFSMIVSTLYFKGSWDCPFENRLTQKDEFYINKELKVEIEFLNNIAYYKYLNDMDNKFKMLEVPYSDKRYSAIFVLPDNMENKFDLNKVFLY